MTDITIPPKALEAVARVLHDHAEIFDDLPWEDLSEDDQECYIEEARAACLAMLRNWPGRKDEWRDNITFDGKPVRYSVIILPLPQEPTASSAAPSQSDG